MAASFQHLEVSDRYRRIYNKSGNNDLIKHLYEIDKLLFCPIFIETLIKFGEMEEYHIQDFSELSRVLISTFFKTYVTLTDHNLINQHHAVLDEYFKAICHDLNKSHMNIKNRILTLLRIKLTVPITQSSLSFHNPTVSISTSYRPKEQELATAEYDIRNILKYNFIKAVKDCTSQPYTYVSHPGTIQLQGPILTKLATNAFIHQQEVMRHSKACGVRTKPFIRNTVNLGLGLGGGGGYDGAIDESSSASGGILVPTFNEDAY